VAPHDARAEHAAYGEDWSRAVTPSSGAIGHGDDTGRLEPEPDRFEFVGREQKLSIPFRDLADLSIACVGFFAASRSCYFASVRAAISASRASRAQAHCTN
jgi:hypothetical protein